MHNPHLRRASSSSTLKEQVENEQDKLEKHGVIKKVPGTPSFNLATA